MDKLQSSFKVAIEELNLLGGRLSVVSSFLTHQTENINNSNHGLDSLLTTCMSFKDITRDSMPNTFIRPGQYKLTNANLNSEIIMIRNRQHLYTLGQAYEILETFLYDEVTELIRLKSNLNIFLNSNSIKSTFTSIRKGLKGLNDRTNNRHLLNILRSNTDIFNKYETENIYKINFRDWLEMLSIVRHCSIHNGGEMTKEVKNTLPSCYEKYFNFKSYNSRETLYINHGSCLQLLVSIADYMFFVYKAVKFACDGKEVKLEDVNHFISNISFIRLIGNKVELLN